MAKTAKIQKSMSARSKGAIALVLLLAVTLCVSYLSVAGMHFGEEGVQQLLPWLPVSSKNWPQSLPLYRALGGGMYSVLEATVAEGEDLAKDLAASKKSVEERIRALGETDGKVILEENAIRVELPRMDSETMHSWIEFIAAPGKFELYTTDGQAVFSAPFVKTSLAVNSSNSGYDLTAEFSKEDTQLLNELAATSSLFLAYCDGAMISYASIEHGKVVISVGTDVNTASNVAVMCLNPVTVTLSHSHDADGEGEVAATLATLLPIVLILCAVLLLAGLDYLCAIGKLTGVSAFLGVWCAVLLECFFYATIVRSTMNAVALVMLVLGLLLALYAAAVRTKAVAAQIAQGSTPKSATKVGLRTAAKQVWIAHGALLVLSLILMIFSFTQTIGYALCCGVTASAFVMPVMRLFQACFIAMTNKAAKFGKVK